MKIVVASDSYKNCMTSLDAANAIEAGIKKVDETINVIKYAVADGGEGTLDAISYNQKTERVVFNARSASGKYVETYYEFAREQAIAYIEVAQIIGVKKQSEGVRAPMYYSSYGVGQAMLHAKRRGAKKIVVCLGGSATNDGGIGILAACGARLYGNQGEVLHARAKELINIQQIDFSKMEKFQGIDIVVACDVKNYLLGEKGATFTFGKQKGLYANQQKTLEKGMIHYVELVRRLRKIDLNAYEGGGAAGGIGACLQGFFHAKMISGLDLVLGCTDFETQIKDADLIITGEGQSDHQTKYGKVPAGIIEVANRYSIKTMIISGALGYEYSELYELGFIGIYSISDRVMTFEQALRSAPLKLEQTTYAIIKTIKAFMHSS